MANLKDIRKRISSVKNTQKITKAMKMVAAAKLRRAQQAVVATRPYADKLFEVIEELLAHIDRGDHPMLRRHDTPRNARVIIVTSDRGLCGGFNANITRAFKTFYEARKDAYEQLEIDLIGRKGRDYLRARKIPTSVYREDVWQRDLLEVAREMSEDITARFLNEQLDEVYVIYTQFKSAIAQEVVIDQLFPLDPTPDKADDDDPDAIAHKEATSFREYIYEPSADELLDELLPRQVTTRIQRALLESVASEQGSRMTAMDNATNNASDMIDSLTLVYNRARQAAITKELIEIVSGAEAV